MLVFCLILIRLNFGQVRADKSNMRVDSFFILIVLLVSGLSSAYLAFDYHLSGVDFEQQKVQALQNQVLQLKLKNEALILQASTTSSFQRQIASVKSNKYISLDGLYRDQLHQAKTEKKMALIKEITQKIIGNSVDADLLAEAYFEKAYLSCRVNFKDNVCLDDVEIIVSQFPETKWARESLTLLSDVYSKLKRFKEADSVMKIVKSEFLQK